MWMGLKEEETADKKKRNRKCKNGFENGGTRKLYLREAIVGGDYVCKQRSVCDTDSFDGDTLKKDSSIINYFKKVSSDKALYLSNKRKKKVPLRKRFRGAYNPHE